MKPEFPFWLVTPYNPTLVVGDPLKSDFSQKQKVRENPEN